MLAAEARAAAFAQLHPPTVFALADPSKIFEQSVGRLADGEISRNARERYALSADGIFNRPSRRIDISRAAARHQWASASTFLWNI
jgi:hypothetical protein